MQEITKELLKWVQESLLSGKSKTDIFSELSHAGYDDRTIDNVLSAVQNVEIKNDFFSASKKPALGRKLLLFLSLGVASAGFSLFAFFWLISDDKTSQDQIARVKTNDSELSDQNVFVPNNKLPEYQISEYFTNKLPRISSWYFREKQTYVGLCNTAEVVEIKNSFVDAALPFKCIENDTTFRYSAAVGSRPTYRCFDSLGYNSEVFTLDIDSNDVECKNVSAPLQEFDPNTPLSDRLKNIPTPDLRMVAYEPEVLEQAKMYYGDMLGSEYYEHPLLGFGFTFPGYFLAYEGSACDEMNIRSAAPPLTTSMEIDCIFEAEYSYVFEYEKVQEIKLADDSMLTVFKSESEPHSEETGPETAYSFLRTFVVWGVSQEKPALVIEVRTSHKTYNEVDFVFSYRDHQYVLDTLLKTFNVDRQKFDLVYGQVYQSYKNYLNRGVQ